MFWSQSLILSCPEARRIGSMQPWRPPMSCLQAVIVNCPRLEVLEGFPDLYWRDNIMFPLIVDSFFHLRTITISPSEYIGSYSHQIDTLKRLNHLQTIIILWKPEDMRSMSLEEEDEDSSAHLDRLKEEWTERVKGVLIAIQRHNNLEKVVVVRDDESERKILLPPLKNLKV